MLAAKNINRLGLYLRILQSCNGTTVTDIIQKTGLPRQSVYRMLIHMEKLEWVKKTFHTRARQARGLHRTAYWTRRVRIIVDLRKNYKPKEIK